MFKQYSYLVSRIVSTVSCMPASRLESQTYRLNPQIFRPNKGARRGRGWLIYSANATTLGRLCSCVTVQLQYKTIRILPIQVRAREKARLCYSYATLNRLGEKNRLCSLQSSKCLRQLLSAISTFLYSGVVI